MSERLSTSDFVAAGQASAAGVAEPPSVNETADNRVPPGSGQQAVSNDKPVMSGKPAQTALFSDKECHDFRSRWDEIQIRFVDDPRKAAEDADTLVAETMRRLAEIFSDERKNMEAQWSRGENVSTEDLRQALQRYRSFFNRLLLV
jgi:hypothetical protein